MRQSNVLSMKFPNIQEQESYKKSISNLLKKKEVSELLAFLQHASPEDIETFLEDMRRKANAEARSTVTAGVAYTFYGGFVFPLVACVLYSNNQIGYQISTKDLWTFIELCTPSLLALQAVRHFPILRLSDFYDVDLNKIPQSIKSLLLIEVVYMKFRQELLAPLQREYIARNGGERAIEEKREDFGI